MTPAPRLPSMQWDASSAGDGTLRVLLNPQALIVASNAGVR